MTKNVMNFSQILFRVNERLHRCVSFPSAGPTIGELANKTSSELKKPLELEVKHLQP